MKIMPVLLFAVATLLCATSPVLSDNYSWDTQKGPDGSWFDADHWSPPDGYPNGRDDGASIDSDSSVLSTVTYPAYQGNCNVNSIQVCANQVSLSNPDGDPDRLNIYGFLGLLASTSDAPPRLVNDGIVFLDGNLHFEEAASEDQYGQILGAGVIQLGANGTLNGTFINGPDQVIEGKGRIGFEGAGPVTLNRGVIRPKFGMLRISGTLKNSPGFGGPAVLRGDAEQDSRLHFDGATLSGGSIEGAAGPVTMEGSTFSNLLIANGTLRLIGTLWQSTMGHGVTIAPGAELRLQGEEGSGTPKLWVRNEQFADPITIQNEGTIALDGFYTNGSAEMRVSVPDGQSPTYVTLAGNGSLLLGLTEYSGNDNGYSSNNLSADSGAGYIQEASHSISGYGRISAPLINLGRVTAANGGTLTLQEDVTNANLTDPDWRTGPFGTLAATPDATLLIVNGALVLLGDLEPDGGTIAFYDGLLEQTFWGPGAYEVVSSGMLELGGVNTLASGALLTVLSGNSSKLRIHGGDELELVNNGEIALHCNTELQQLGDGPALFSGHGTISLGVAGTGMTKLTGDAPLNGGQNMGFINGPGHTIRGAGSMYTDLVNQGEVIAENGYLVVSYPFHLSGTGNVQVNNNGWLDWWGDLSAHDFTMDATGRLWPNFSTPTLVLSGNFSFAQTDEDQWLADGKAARHSMTLQSRDGARQTLEIGGMDYGEDLTGFNGYGAPNFDLSILTVSGASTRVQLVDAVDNGNRSGQNEALYAWTLEVATGATLDLNCLSLYTWYNGAVHRVTDGDGHLFGGGEIIDTCGQSHHNLSPIMMLLLR